MRKTILLLLFLATGIATAFSQAESMPIEIDRSTFRSYLYQDCGRITVTPERLCEIVKDVPEAQHDAKVAKNFAKARNNCYYITGASILTYLAARYLPWDNRTTYLLRLQVCEVVCVGSLVASCVLGPISNHHATKAAKIYNAKIGETSYNDVNLDFGFTPGGVGMTLSF